MVNVSEHATEFCWLTIFCGNLLNAHLRIGWRQVSIAGFSLAIMFAASDEWHQTFVKGRDGNVRGVLIDTCGALVGALVLARRNPCFVRHASPPAGSRGSSAEAMG